MIVLPDPTNAAALAFGFNSLAANKPTQKSGKAINMGKISETALVPSRPAAPATLTDMAAHLLKASDGAVPLLKFRKGKYFVGDAEVPVGGEYLAYCADWVQGFVKFANNKIADSRTGRVSDGFRPPEREELGDLDESRWPIGIDGKPADPWQFQHYLPLENTETGDRYRFVSGSAGGAMAVRAVCNKYARNITRGLPTIRLAVSEFTSKKYDATLRPDFEIVRWENDGGSVDVLPPIKQELNDEIPF
jgi:hypothetical protein